jgi:hypothetical protein
MMATNLVSTIMQSLSSEVIGKIASSLALQPSPAQKAIAAAVPGMLAGLANTASTQDGAQKLGAALSQIHDVPDPNSMQVSSLAETGSSMLSSLMGSSSVDKLSSAVTQFAGISQGTVKKLLALLAPLVLGFLKREQMTAGLDNKGLANLLVSQRSTIEHAMPAGVAQRLQDSAPSVPSGSFRQAPADTRSSMGRWVYWLLPALIVASAAFYLLQNGGRITRETNQDTTTSAQQPSSPAKDTAQVNPPAQRDLQPAPVSTSSATATGGSTATLENDIIANLSRLRAALQTIKDPASAQAAMSELKDISDRFGRLKSVAQQLSPESRKALAAAVASKVPDLNGLIARIENDNNLSGAAKPAMDTLKSELASLTKA